MIKKVIMKDQECGYLLRNGKYERLLTAGVHWIFPDWGCEVKKVSMKGEVDRKGIPEDVLMKDPEFASRVVKAVLPDTSIAIRFVNGAFHEVLTKPENLFWNVFERNEFQTLDITATDMEEVLPRMYLELMPPKFYKRFTVKEGEAGLLYIDGRYERRLETGTYYFWNYGREVTMRTVDLRVRQMEIAGQEILTADKVGVRLNVVCSYQFTDPERLVATMENPETQVYAFVQLILREYVGNYRLDELLARREEIGRLVWERMKEQGERYCARFLLVGIKDIILPGEIREIMNTVLVAEKKAQANVIMRREEVASTRSLLNTARLMEENRVLYHLKEMEYLERICDKVGSISVAGGRGILEQLGEMMGTKENVKNSRHFAASLIR